MPTALEIARRKLEELPPQTQVPVIRGVNLKRKKNGLTIMSLHYSAIPDRDPETEKGAEWFNRENSGYASQSMWKKEQEMDPYATGGEAVFGSILGNPKLYELVVISDPHWHPDPRWDVVGGFDHGVTNATCLLKGYIPRESWDPKTGQKNPPELIICGEFYRYRQDSWNNNVDENVGVMRQMPDMERARWITADPSIFYDAVASDRGAPTNIYKTYRANGMWPMSSYGGIRSDASFVEWIMSDFWKGLAVGRKPRLKIVCRNPSDRPQPGLHEFDCPNLLWEMKRARRVQMTSRQLLTKNASEALENKNNHALDPLKMVTGLVRTATAIPPMEAINEELAELDSTTAPIRARFLMSDLVRSGRIGPDGKPTTKPAVTINMRRAPGMLPRR